MNKGFVDYFRCPEIYADFRLAGEPAGNAGYFRFGPNAICYGRTSSGFQTDNLNGDLYDAAKMTRIHDATCLLPFDLAHIVDNLRHEKYCANSLAAQSKNAVKALARSIYYLVRPVLPVSVRKHFQRIHLKDWQSIPFPRWPVDFSIEELFEQILLLILRDGCIKKIPFIWFWPEARQGCVMMTHDVETTAGRDFCSHLMDMNEAFGIKSSFQIVPEKRYEVTTAFLRHIQERGFEVNVHGLNHDGHLFGERKEFLRRAERINQYAREYGAVGFRSPVMYRNVEWFDALDFSYDMSIPNVAHLDPQRGGCCTVMPYFIGHILELPLTTTQDYSLFNILNDYSLTLWKKQMDLIGKRHGLISFIIHPDYIIPKRNRSVYLALLQYLADIGQEWNLWGALPKEIDAWWRQRSKMKLVRNGGKWQIVGKGRERARVAYATLHDGRVAYEIEETEALGLELVNNKFD